MNARKVMAVTLATAMVVGSSMTVFADGESTETTESANMTGTGGVEGYVDTDVKDVVFPTTSAFTFTIDPQGLIAATGAAKYSSASYEDGATLLFKNEAEGATYNYSSTSDTYTVTNKSSKGVSISVEATMTSLDATLDGKTYTIGISETSTFTGDTPAIYMALVDENGEVALDSTEAKATLAGSASAAPDGAYEVVYSSGYTYQLASDFEGEFDTYDFYITGASNADADWTDYTSITPSLAVTWSAELVEEEAPTFTATSTGLTYTTGSGDAALKSITSITMTNTYGAFDGYNANAGLYAAATDAEGTITFDSAYKSYYTDTTNGYTATVVYVNAANEKVTVTVEGVFKAN